MIMSENRILRALERPALGGLLAVLLLAAPPAGAQDGNPKSSARGYLGVMVAPTENADRGVVVRDIAPGSPAASSGLKNGDRITKIGDEEVRDVKSFMQSVAAKKPGEKLNLRVQRNDKEQTVSVTLAQRPANQEAGPSGPGGPARGSEDGPTTGRRPAFLGVQTQPLTPEAKKRLDIRSEGGVLVTEVVPNSPAAKAGLKNNDVITGINDRSITDPGQLREAVQKAGPGQ